MESDIHDGNIVERVIPTESVQLMFHYKNPFVVYHPKDSTRHQPRSIVSGLSDSFSDVSTNGEAGVVFVSFYPAGACYFFDFPLSEIENQSIDLSEIFKTEINRVEELLYFAKTTREKINVIENFLSERFSPIPKYDSLLVQKGINIINNCKGRTNAASVAGLLSTTPKTLERKFSRYLGKTTKQIIKLIRFQGVLHDFSVHKNISLTERAYNNGYFDQSHFIRDFKTFSGYTPGEFVKNFPDYNSSGDSC
jgi:AraC-like DNA-binding protein